MGLVTAIIFAIGGVICHQQPDRSFFWNGHQFPVCARCTGLYLSGIAGILLWLVFRSALSGLVSGTNPDSGSVRSGAVMRMLAVAAVPTAVSVATGALGVWDGSNMTRALLAIPLGVVAGGMVAAVFTKDLR